MKNIPFSHESALFLYIPKMKKDREHTNWEHSNTKIKTELEKRKDRKCNRKK